MLAELERLPAQLLDMPLAECVRAHGWDWVPVGFAPLPLPPGLPAATMTNAPPEDKENASAPASTAAKGGAGRQKRVTLVTDCRPLQVGGKKADAEGEEVVRMPTALAPTGRRMTRAQSMAQCTASAPPGTGRKRKAPAGKQSMALHPELPPTPKVSRARRTAAQDAMFPAGAGGSPSHASDARPSLARRITLCADLDAPEGPGGLGIQLALEDGTALTTDNLKTLGVAERRLFLEQVSAMQSQLSSFCARLAEED